jgi:D-3-phosphoglycerate dehydrogenase
MPSALVNVAVFAAPDEAGLNKLRQGGWDVRVEPEGMRADEEGLVALLEGQDAVIAGGEPYTRRVLERSPRLKHIARWGVGFDRVDVPAATDLGVLVTTTQGANDWGVADHAMALILGLAHLLVANDREVRAGRWPRPIGADVWRRTLGLVGLGRIGKGVAQRARGFEMTVVACEPSPDHAFVERHGIELIALEEVLRRSDFVSLHLPGGAETHHIIDAERLALMKPTAYLVNTARGTLIDEDALYAALNAGRLAGAGLDVREAEPPHDTRFNELPNVILTSHIAGVTDGTVAAMNDMAVESIFQGMRGEVPHGLLNPEAWERRRR